MSYRRAELPGAEKPKHEVLPEAKTMVGEVFASPYRLQVQGSERQAGRETLVLAYPDICFTVDGSHNGLDQLVRLLFKFRQLGASSYAYSAASVDCNE